MKLLFVHDHIFYGSEDGDIYSAAAYPRHAWDRYLESFDQVVVIGRYAGIIDNPQDTLVLSSRPNVSFSFVNRPHNPIKNLLSLGNVKPEIKRQVADCDAVVVRLPSENGLTAIACAKEANVPYSVEVVGCAWDALWNHGSIPAKIYAPIALFRMKRAIASSVRTLYVTNKFLQMRYPSKAGALTVPASNVEIEIPDRGLVEKRDWSKKKLIIGLIGNYKTRYKGIHLAIEVLASLQKKFNDFDFRVLGRGDSSEYKAMAYDFGIGDKVVFYGGLPNGEPVMRWLDEIDIYMQPSLQEGLPRSLIEAMSRGCVCVASDAGGSAELLPAEFIHKAGDVGGFAKVLEAVLVDKKNFPAISLENYERAKKYEKSLLQKIRCDFYAELKKAVSTK